MAEPKWLIEADDEDPNSFMVIYKIPDEPDVGIIIANHLDEPVAYLLAEAREMQEAMQEFVDRCERGEVRSRHTYRKFEKILARLKTITPD